MPLFHSSDKAFLLWVRTTALLSDENDKLHKCSDVRLPKAPLEIVVMVSKQ